jgi:hypothetical protein
LCDLILFYDSMCLGGNSCNWSPWWKTCWLVWMLVYVSILYVFRCDYDATMNFQFGESSLISKLFKVRPAFPISWGSLHPSFYWYTPIYFLYLQFYDTSSKATELGICPFTGQSEEIRSYFRLRIPLSSQKTLLETWWRYLKPFKQPTINFSWLIRIGSLSWKR